MNKESVFLKAKYIIIWDGKQHRQLEDGYLEIRGNEIVDFHRKLAEGTPYEDLGNSAIIPGFINLHCHPSEVYGGRSYKEDQGNANFYDSTLYDYAGLVERVYHISDFRGTGVRTRGRNSRTDRNSSLYRMGCQGRRRKRGNQYMGFS